MASLLETYKKDIAFKSDFIITASGDLDTVEGLNNIQQALYRRLITSKGTLIHRPDYGVGIKDYQNAITSAAKQIELLNRIRDEFPKDPRVDEVLGMSINKSDTAPDKIQMLVKIRLVGYGDATLSFLPFDEES